MPVYDDWESATQLLARLNAVLKDMGTKARVVFVDDGSTIAAPATLDAQLEQLARIEVVHLRKNLGHQRAIAIGLTHLHSKSDTQPIVVMDADGQDKASDIPKLIKKFEELKGERIVFAARTRRSEGWLFRIGYHAYRALHVILTGIPVRVGNFSVLDQTHLDALVVAPDLWNHYAATVVKIRLPHAMVSTDRGVRIAGQSSLNLTGMVVHGLSAISVFIETVTVRVLVTMAIVLGLLLASFAIALAVRASTGLAVPNPALLMAGFFLVLVVQMMTAALGLTLMILFNRNSLSFLPIRDWQFFVRDVRVLHDAST